MALRTVSLQEPSAEIVWGKKQPEGGGQGKYPFPEAASRIGRGGHPPAEQPGQFPDRRPSDSSGLGGEFA